MQQELVSRVCLEFESEKEDDSDAIMKARTDKIVDLMQNVSCSFEHLIVIELSYSYLKTNDYSKCLRIIVRLVNAGYVEAANLAFMMWC